MAIIVFILLIILAISGFSAYYIGLKVHGSLAKTGNKNAMLFSIITGVVSFLVILCGISFLIIINLDFHR
ncbi:MAG TPA: hypothetical protein VG738_14000 [Chitinophagaceae bacterium]|nr:hypothetical protein [Chitinophagaceae bacterium]